MDQLKDIYKSLADKEEALSFAYKMHQAHLLWKRAVDEKILKNTEPYRIKDGVLFVLTANPVWAQQLTFLKNEILLKINALPGEIKINDIQFRAGELKNEKRISGEKEETSGNVITRGGSGETQIDLPQMERLHKQWGWSKCRECGGYYHERGEGCFYCGKEKADNEQKNIYRMLRMSPWVTYKDIKTEINSANPEKIEKIRRRITARLKDDIFAIIKEIEKEKNKKTAAVFKTMAHEYVMHKSGLHPRQINEKIIRKYLSAKAFKLLYPREEQEKNGKKRSR